MSNVASTLTAVGSVRPAGAAYALHVLLVDDSDAAYDMRAVALRLTSGAFLMVYSQPGIIASKASGASLHIAFDLTIDADTAATVTFGDTDYLLPAASLSAPGIVELATSAETTTGTDAVRAVTPAGMKAGILNGVRTNALVLAQNQQITFAQPFERNVVIPIRWFEPVPNSSGNIGNIVIDEVASGQQANLALRNKGDANWGVAQANFIPPTGATITAFQVLVKNPNSLLQVQLGYRVTDWTLPLEDPYTVTYANQSISPGSGLRLITIPPIFFIPSSSDIHEWFVFAAFPPGSNGDSIHAFRFRYNDPGPVNH